MIIVICMVKLTRSQKPAPNHVAAWMGELPTDRQARKTTATAMRASAKASGNQRSNQADRRRPAVESMGRRHDIKRRPRYNPFAVTPLLEMRGISKSFPGVRALDGVSLSVQAGEVHFLLGQNGAGKSTLIRTLCGAHRPDAGEILLDGKPVRLASPADARA